MRYGGSKWQRSKRIVSLIPPTAMHYYEPFCGIASVFRRIMQSGPTFHSYNINDLDSDVYRFPLMVRGDLQDHGNCIERLDATLCRFMPERDHEPELRQYFEECKVRWIEHDDPFAWFFLHLYAVGQYVFRPSRRPNIASFDPTYLRHGLACWTLEKARWWRTMFQQASLTNVDALALLEDLNATADHTHLVFLDPPYEPPHKAFHLYPHDFSEHEHRVMAGVLRESRFYFMLTMGNYPLTWELYLNDPAFEMIPLRCTYCGHRRQQKDKRDNSRNVKTRDRKKTKEWLIIPGPNRFALL